MFTTISPALIFLENWIFPYQEYDFYRLTALLTGEKRTRLQGLVQFYLDLLLPYRKLLSVSDREFTLREADGLASGIIFFYGCLIYVMHFPNWGNYLEDIVLYNVLYLLVDHYLDDPTVDCDRKDRAVAEMFRLLDSSLALSEDSKLTELATIYHQLISRRPQLEPFIRRLFEAEVEGLTIQRRGDLDRQSYMNIAQKKGGLTVQVLLALSGQYHPQDMVVAYQLGAILQLLDDLLDVDSDIQRGIHTIASFELANNRLDRIWLEIVTMISQLGSSFAIFKIIYSHLIIYVGARSNHIGETLKSECRARNLFGFNSSLLLTQTINSYLCQENITQ